MQPAKLIRYFFPVQEVQGNPEHQSENEQQTAIRISANFTSIENASRNYIVEITVQLDEDKSENPPYFFKIESFGIFEAADENLNDDQAKSLATTTGAQILIGAIRERIATMTSRGPWGILNLNTIPLVVDPMIPKEGTAETD
jgi:preprotein translocase subunit SecB